MASPRTIDLILSNLIDRIQAQYIKFIRATLLGDEYDPTRLIEMTARALLLADLEGRAYATVQAKRGGVELEFDDDRQIDLIPDLPDNLQYAAGNVGPDIPNLPAAAVAVTSPRIGGLITGKPLKTMAKAFRNAVPQIGQRIVAQALRMGGLARKLWAEESVAVLKTLAPIIEKQLEEGVSMQEFFFDAQRATQRAEFREVARSRLENVFRTNLTSAAGEAAFEASHDEKIMFAVWGYQYHAVDDNRVRPQHWAFDGFIAPKDWPHWRTIMVPNGYMCRCAPGVTLFTGDARRLGLVDDKGQTVAKRYQKTWNRAIAAGLLTATGDLTYPRQVQMIDRLGNKHVDSFPQQGFGG